MTSPDTPKDMLGRTGLIQVEAAQTLLISSLDRALPESETISIIDGLDRVLAGPVISTENLPPHPRSVMDGFAVQARDTFGASESMPCYLQITGSVAMGEMPSGEVAKGCCHKIATGGFLPAGADAVVMLENTIPVDDTMVEIVKSMGSGGNTIGTGDDIRENEQPLAAGHLLRPQDLGLLAGLGFHQVKVYKKVRVGIVSTGDEIIPYTSPLTPGKIRNINSIALSGLIQRADGLPVDLGIVSDTRDVFSQTLRAAVQDHDIVIFSGGSSVGVRDLGEEIIEELGPPGVLVHGVALKPGKPVLIGMSDTTPIFGLPGHPVSAMVCFEMFVEPTIAALSGKNIESVTPRPSVTAELSRNMNSAAGRKDLVRVTLTKKDDILSAEPVMGKSGAISTLSKADGYFIIDEESQGVTQGSMIEVFIYR